MKDIEKEVNVKKEIAEELINLEAYAKEGKQAPKGKRYLVKIDKVIYEVDKQEITGRELLVLSNNMPPENYRLDIKYHGGFAKKVELNEVVDLTTPGIEKFMTNALDQTEG
jgi:hypothetical protein